MWSKLALLALCLLICGTPLYAQQPSSSAPMRGTGVTTCAQFADYMRRNPSNEDLFYTWAQGFMSGLNQTISEVNKLMVGDRLRGAGVKNLMASTNWQQKSKLRMYCDRYPLRTYGMAVLELYAELPPISPRKD